MNLSASRWAPRNRRGLQSASGLGPRTEARGGDGVWSPPPSSTHPVLTGPGCCATRGSGQAGADQAGLVGGDHQLGAVPGAELGHGPVDVGLGCEGLMNS